MRPFNTGDPLRESTAERQALIDFLTKNRQGYCQQFAFAMAVLARELDIPSRVAVGYTEGSPIGHDRSTSISGGLLYSMSAFDSSPIVADRRTIDVSGDGANNSGPFVTIARDDVLAAGLTINGLPIMLKRPNSFTMDVENLDVYYEDCVISGPGAFAVSRR